MNAQVNIPEGYWLDAKATLYLMPMSKKLTNCVIKLFVRIWALAKALHQEMKNFKAIFADVASFVQISTDQYGAKIGGTKAMFNS
jgi:hypothetical protein